MNLKVNIPEVLEGFPLCLGAEAAGNYLCPHPVETGIKNFAPEGKTSRLKRGDQRRRRAFFLIFVSNGRNDIVNGQEGVHHFRVEKLP